MRIVNDVPRSGKRGCTIGPGAGFVLPARLGGVNKTDYH
jgi:hypothetical protein